MDNLENLPEKYSGLLPNLNRIYVVTQDDINDANANLIATAGDKQFNRAYTHPEHAEHMINGFSTEEAKQYLLEDPLLKNKTAEYMDAFRYVAMMANIFRIQSVELYKQIITLLGNRNNDIPKLPKLTPNKEFIEPYLGEDTHYEDNEIFSRLSAKHENDQLFFTSDGEQTDLYWHNEYYFLNRRSVIFRFFKNKEGQHFLRISNGVRGQVLIKD